MQSHLDPISVAISVSSLIFAPALASVIGPYAVIVMSATVGASWALGRRRRDAKIKAALFFVRINATAMLITVSLANLAARWAGSDDSAWMLGPIAFAVGAVGDDWPQVGSWCIAQVGRFIERKTGGGA